MDINRLFHGTNFPTYHKNIVLGFKLKHWFLLSYQCFLNPHPHHGIVINKEFPTGYHWVSTPILKISNNPWISMQRTSNLFQIICNYCCLIYSYRSDLGRSFSEGPPCKPVKKEPPLIPTWTKYFQKFNLPTSNDFQYTNHVPLTLLVVHPALHSPYFQCTTLLQSLILGLHNRAFLGTTNVLIAKPPIWIEKQSCPT